MARAELNDGQSLLAVNDLFIGQKTHASARYRLRLGDEEEDQSSSGIIVSTGAGSTGWHRSILTGAAGIAASHLGDQGAEPVGPLRDDYRFDWEAQYLVFHVREPFISHTSGAEVVYGRIDRETPLEIVSHMPQNGVIFGDGVEEDRLDSTAGPSPGSAWPTASSGWSCRSAWVRPSCLTPVGSGRIVRSQAGRPDRQPGPITAAPAPATSAGRAPAS